MKLKALEEKRSEILAQIEEENKSETRSIDKVDELLAKLDEVNKEIKVEERLLEVMDKNKTAEKKQEMRNFNAEIRAAIESEKELDITDFEVEERGIGVGEVSGKVTKTTKDIAKKTFANSIIKKVADVSDLYKYVRKENLGAATHQIPVQKSKIGKFANVKELADYAAQEMEYAPIQMGAHKYGAITILSEECIADTGYDIMGDLLEQYGEGAGLKMDELLVKGDSANNVQGLESFIDSGNGNAVAGEETKVVKITTANSKKQDELLKGLMEVYNTLPRQYAKNATWVVSPEIAGVLNTAVDGMGRPLLYQDFTGVPFGGKPTPMLLGRPVVICDEVKSLTAAAQHNPIAFFGDLNKALICGIRQNFTIKTSTEYGFINDGIAVKGTMRLDVKRALTEAMAALVIK